MLIKLKLGFAGLLVKEYEVHSTDNLLIQCVQLKGYKACNFWVFSVDDSQINTAEHIPIQCKF